MSIRHHPMADRICSAGSSDSRPSSIARSDAPHRRLSSFDSATGILPFLLRHTLRVDSPKTIHRTDLDVARTWVAGHLGGCNYAFAIVRLDALARVRRLFDTAELNARSVHRV